MKWINLFNDYNIDYVTHRSNLSEGWIGVNCPHPRHRGRDDEYKLGIHPETNSCNCWKCGVHSYKETIQHLLKIDKSEVNRILAQYSGKTNIRVEKRRAEATVIQLPPNSFTGKELKYLHSRGFTEEHIKEYDLRGGGLAGKWQYRIVIPIYQDGRIVSATGRAIDKRMELRYYTLSKKEEVVEHKHTLFGEDKVVGDTIVVVEGPLDAIKGGAGFVATYGTSITREQIHRMSKYSNVLLLLDNDDAGIIAKQRISSDLATMGINVEDIELDTEYKDLGEMPPDLISTIRRELL